MALKSLRQRLFLMVLLPVGLLLLFIGVFGFIYMRGTLFQEWQDASIVKLQRAAHRVDMRLGRINDWIQMFHKTADTLGGPLVQTWIVQQLKDMKGVTHAELKWKDNSGSQVKRIPMNRGGGSMGGGSMSGWQYGRGTYDAFSPGKNYGSDTPELQRSDRTGNGENYFPAQG